MHIHGRDSRYISVTRPGTIEKVSTLQSGETKTTTKQVNSAYYVNPMNDGHVDDDDLLEAFFEEEQFKTFLPDGCVDGDDLGYLPSGIRVNVRNVITAMVHASAGGWHRIFFDNVVGEKAGYLTGEAYSHICAGSYCGCSAFLAALLSSFACIADWLLANIHTI